MSESSSAPTFCDAIHPMTGAHCELSPGHTQNHRGQFENGIAQWPDPQADPVSPIPAEPPVPSDLWATVTRLSAASAFRYDPHMSIYSAKAVDKARAAVESQHAQELKEAGLQITGIDWKSRAKQLEAQHAQEIERLHRNFDVERRGLDYLRVVVGERAETAEAENARLSELVTVREAEIRSLAKHLEHATDRVSSLAAQLHEKEQEIAKLRTWLIEAFWS